MSIPLTIARRTALAVVAAGLSSIRLRADVEVNHPFEGVTYSDRTEISPRKLKMHIVEVDLDAPGIRFRLTPPGGSAETLRQTTLDFLVQQEAQVAINAHFFLPYLTADVEANVVGLAASDGVVYSAFEPQPIALNQADQSYAIIPFAPALNIDRFSHATVVHRDPAWPDNKHILEPVTLWNAISGSAQIVTDGAPSIPAYSGPPAGLNPVYGYSDTNSWYEMTRARTAIGVTKDAARLVLFTVDQTGGSAGMTVSEVAGLLIRDYQVFNALNLDGGPSTTLAIQDPVTGVAAVVNVPIGGVGEILGSNLAVFARPSEELLGLRAFRSPGGDTVILSWPMSLANWHLQEASDLSLTKWSDVVASTQQIGGHVQVARPVQAEAGFYRLIP